MGYTTHFTLELKDDPDGYWEAGLEQRAEEAYRARDFDDLSLVLLHDNDIDEPRWYEHEADMAALSAEYPSALFELYGEGEGEDAGDIWKLWARGGKTIKVEAKIVIEKPDLGRVLPPPDAP